MRTIWASLALATLAACTAAGPAPVSATQGATVHPVSGLEIIPVTVTTGSGVHTFRTEVADTPKKRSRGMMGRTEMGADEAMIFLYDDMRNFSFWMKDTPLPLDIIFIDDDRRIINIGEGVPYSEADVKSNAPGIAVLELVGGLAAELGIEPGDRVEW